MSEKLSDKIKKNSMVTPEMVKEAISPTVEENEGKNGALPEEIGQRIYIGPNMLQLTTYTVMESEFPRHITDLITKCPAVGKLFVPVEELTVAEPRTKTKGTIEHRQYSKVLDYINGKQGE